MQRQKVKTRGVPNLPASKRPQRQLQRVDITVPDASKANRTCFALKGVLSPPECEALIADTESRGYEDALISTYGGQVMDKTVRNSGRVMVDDEKTAKDWFGRIAPHLPPSIGRGGHVAEAGARKLVGLNERLRYLRYSPGEYFAPHQDGSYRRPDGSESSLLTLMVYLNTSDQVVASNVALTDGRGDGGGSGDDGGGPAVGGFAGGETNFLDWRDEDHKVSFVPEAGDVLIFDHALLHEGAAVTRGVKYCVRTDIMYTVPKERQSQERREAAGGGGGSREHHLN